MIFAGVTTKIGQMSFKHRYSDSGSQVKNKRSMLLKDCHCVKRHSSFHEDEDRCRLVLIGDPIVCRRSRGWKTERSQIHVGCPLWCGFSDHSGRQNQKTKIVRSLLSASEETFKPSDRPVLIVTASDLVQMESKSVWMRHLEQNPSIWTLFLRTRVWIMFIR